MHSSVPSVHNFITSRTQFCFWKCHGFLAAGLQLVCLHPAGLEWHPCACEKHWGDSVLFWGKEDAHGSGVAGAALPCAPSHPQQDNGICPGRDDVKLPHLPSAACPGQGALRQLIPSLFKWPETSKVSLNK